MSTKNHFCYLPNNRFSIIINTIISSITGICYNYHEELQIPPLRPPTSPGPANTHLEVEIRMYSQPRQRRILLCRGKASSSAGGISGHARPPGTSAPAVPGHRPPGDYTETYTWIRFIPARSSYGGMLTRRFYDKE